MSRSPLEQAAWDQQAYGCAQSDLDHIMDSYCKSSGELSMLSMSILSDAQELLDATSANSNIVRQFMNRAKYVISKQRDLQRG